MTGRPVTPAQQAADVLAAHGIWDAYGGDKVRCYCNRGEHVVVWMNRIAHAEHQAAALAAAGVLTDPDTHDRDAVPGIAAVLCRATHGQTDAAHCPNCLSRAQHIYLPIFRAALDGAGTDARGEGA